MISATSSPNLIAKRKLEIQKKKIGIRSILMYLSFYFYSILFTKFILIILFMFHRSLVSYV